MIFKWDEILTKELLVEQYTNLKKSTCIIAKEIGCSRTTINTYLNKHNILIRSLSEALKGHEGFGKGMKRKPFLDETLQKMRKAKKGKYNGKNNPNFKGGKKKDKDGYILVYSPNHPHKTKNNNVRENRLIVESQIGRYLLPTEVVHHINGKKDDNRIENLMCFINNSAHTRFHKNPNNVKSEEIIFDGRKLKEK